MSTTTETLPSFTTYSQDPYTYVCPACDGHGGDANPWMHPHDPRQTWADCATCAGLGELDYRELDIETLDDFAWWGKAPDDMARIVAIAALDAIGELTDDGLMSDDDRRAVAARVAVPA